MNQIIKQSKHVTFTASLLVLEFLIERLDVNLPSPHSFAKSNRDRHLFTVNSPFNRS